MTTLDRLKNEPVLLWQLAAAGISLAGSFGFSLTVEQTAAVFAVFQILAALMGRQLVTPTRKLDQDPRPLSYYRKPRPPRSTTRGLMILAAVLVLTACRPPFPYELGSGQVIFEDTTILISVRDCIRESVMTEETRAAVHRAESEGPLPGRLSVVFHRGPSRYLGGGVAEVGCEDAGAIPRLAAEHRREVAR